MKYEIPQMIKQGGGAIVNAGSLVSLTATPLLGAYAASKGGILQFRAWRRWNTPNPAFA